jgi:hypothetical protein
MQNAAFLRRQFKRPVNIFFCPVNILFVRYGYWKKSILFPVEITEVPVNKFVITVIFSSSKYLILNHLRLLFSTGVKEHCQHYIHFSLHIGNTRHYQLISCYRGVKQINTICDMISNFDLYFVGIVYFYFKIKNLEEKLL